MAQRQRHPRILRVEGQLDGQVSRSVARNQLHDALVNLVQALGQRVASASANDATFQQPHVAL
jgi:hypothetical protein